MKKRTFRFLEELIEDYYQMDEYISNVEEELRYPWKESDDNIGGGRGSMTSDPTAKKALTVAEDKQLRLLKERKKALDNVINRARPETLEVISLWYWRKPRTLTWDGIAERTNYSRRTCMLLREQFVDDLAKELGEII